MKYLNLGCGSRYHPNWTNIDFTSTNKSIIAHNLNRGIPFPDDAFDVVYHSHVLEHFTKTSATNFLQECYRVLRPQGVLRVVVPDLEQIARTYLMALEKASGGCQEWASNYEWILLEMYDQTVRNKPGGEMVTYLQQKNIVNEDFILSRCGVEAKNLIDMNKKQETESKAKALLRPIYRFCRYANYRQNLLFKLLLGRQYAPWQVGQFRQNGEPHQWMYDRYSLSVLLKQCGLKNIVQRSPIESYIPEWASFNLDTEPDGTVYKPDSLFMEAIKLPM
jgi:predicted SAM-dependent methyltransferase